MAKKETNKSCKRMKHKRKTQHWTKSPFNLKDTKYSSTFYSFISIILSYLIHEFFLVCPPTLTLLTTTNNNIKYQECAFLFIQYSFHLLLLLLLVGIFILFNSHKFKYKKEYKKMSMIKFSNWGFMKILQFFFSFDP